MSSFKVTIMSLMQDTALSTVAGVRSMAVGKWGGDEEVGSRMLVIPLLAAVRTAIVFVGNLFRAGYALCSRKIKH